MALIDQLAPLLSSSFGYTMRALGIVLTVGLYLLISLHVYAFFEVIAPVLKKRLGTRFGLVWCAIGLILLYNVVFNHFFAMTVRPGCPKDLDRTER